MKAYTMGARALTESGNQIKEIFLEKMVQEGKLTKEQEEDMNQYCIIVHERGFFGQLWDKFFKWDKNSDFKINVVKVVK